MVSLAATAKKLADSTGVQTSGSLWVSFGTVATSQGFSAIHPQRLANLSADDSRWWHFRTSDELYPASVSVA